MLITEDRKYYFENTIIMISSVYSSIVPLDMFEIRMKSRKNL